MIPPRNMEAEIAVAKQRLRSDQPRYGSDRVQAILGALHTAESDGKGREQLRELFVQLREGESR